MKGAWLALLWAGNAVVDGATADQRIEISRAIDFFAVEIEVGRNTVAELFPTAPLGTVIFTFDNATGYHSTTMRETGWSNPVLRIEPGQGAIMAAPLATGEVLQFDLAGSAPAGPVELYRGWNLVSGSSVRFPQGAIGQAPNSGTVYAQDVIGFRTSTYDDLLDKWSPSLVSASGEGVWFQTEAWPANPEGTFNLLPAVYLGDPYSASERLLVFDNGCGPTNAVVFLERETASRFESLGEAMPVQPGEKGGSLALHADPVRHLPSPGTYTFRLRMEGEDGWWGTGLPITMEVNQSLVPRSISVPAIAPLLPVFRSQPMSVAPEAGATVELRAIYNYPPHFGEPATESIETIPCGEAEPCPVQFQWQKRTGVAAWTDVPGATTDTLTIGEIKPDQLGMYRLRVSWGPCFADYSNAAMVGPSPVYLDVRAVESESAVHLNVKSPGEAEAVIHGSANLEDWTPVATNTVHGEWTVMVPKSTDFRFFKIEAE